MWFQNENMATNEEEDIVDSEAIGTVLNFPPSVQEAIDQVGDIAHQFLSQICLPHFISCIIAQY